MREWGQGKLHSGSSSGPVVKNQKQAEAIAFSEQKKLGGKADPPAPKKKAKAKSGPAIRPRATAGRFDGPPAPPGMSGWKTRPRPLNNPKTLSGRRTASHDLAYPDQTEED